MSDAATSAIASECRRFADMPYGERGGDNSALLSGTLPHAASLIERQAVLLSEAREALQQIAEHKGAWSYLASDTLDKLEVEHDPA